MDMHTLRFVHVCQYGRKTTSTGEQMIRKAGGNEAAFTKMIGKAGGNEATCTICTVYAATDEQRKSVSSSPAVLTSLHVGVSLVHIRGMVLQEDNCNHALLPIT